MNENQSTNNAPETKFCTECGQKIAKKAVVCPHCGCQVDSVASKGETAAPQIVINNTNQNSNQNNNVGTDAGVFGRKKNKWVALLFLFFLGAVGGHKFYEGKIGMGILYFFTCGLLGIGLIVDFFVLLFKPTHYYVD